MAIEKGEGGINPEKRSRLSSSHRADHGERNLEKKRWMDFDLSFGNELHLVNEQLLPPPLNSTAGISRWPRKSRFPFQTFLTDWSQNCGHVDRWKLFFADLIGELLTCKFLRIISIHFGGFLRKRFREFAFHCLLSCFHLSRAQNDGKEILSDYLRKIR